MNNKCFVCTTPYQIIAATAITINDKNENDLIIVPQFSNAEDYAKRIRTSKLYSSVYLVDTSEIEAYKKHNNTLLYGMGIVKNYLSLDQVVPKMIGKKNYKSIYISSQANVGRLIGLYYRKKGAEIVYFDDGEGSYDDKKIYEAQGIDRKIRTILFGRDSIYLSKKRQLYCPELYKMTFGNHADVTSIRNWSNDSELLKKINYICDYSDEVQIQERFILLDTIPSESFDEKGQKKYNSLVDVCAKELSNSLLIKKHPRDCKDHNGSIAMDKYQSIPFELVCANSDIGNKVLISAGSSAVLMPKLLFNAEPTVVMLHHITGSKLGDNIMREQMFTHIMELYDDKSKFVVPETIDEFEAIIKDFKLWEEKTNDLL